MSTKHSSPLKLRWLVPLVLPLLLTSCLYTNVRVPLDRDLDASRLGDKVGTSEFQSVLWLVAWGDAGTQAAARNGGITVIHHADQHVLSILLGLYSKQTTILYGE
jgi:hypothetical protein